MFNKKDATEMASSKRAKLINTARSSMFGVGLTKDKREEMLLAGIYVELAAIRDAVAPVKEGEDEEVSA